MLVFYKMVQQKGLKVFIENVSPQFYLSQLETKACIIWNRKTKISQQTNQNLVEI